MLQWFTWWNLIFWLPPLVSFFVFMHLRKNERRRTRPFDTKNRPPAGASLDSMCEPNPILPAQIYEQEPPKHKTSLEIFLHFLSRGIFHPAVTLVLFSSLWGVFGLWINHVLSQRVGVPILFIWISILSATVLSVAVCLLITKTFTFWKKEHEGKEELIGCEGEAMFRVTLESGIAEVCGEDGKIHRVQCRIERQGNIIPEGDHLLIVGYDRDEDKYLVKRNQSRPPEFP